MTQPIRESLELAAVRSVGGVLPVDVLSRVVDPRGGLPGLRADDFGLELGVTPVEAANRAWSVLSGAWAGYTAAREKLPEGERATSLTREKWLLVLLRELGFGRVPTSPAGGVKIEDRSFPVSHLADSVPVHLLGWGVDLDRKTPGLAGAAERAPHAMVQDLLNRSDEHLWAIVANDSTLRLLRDSSTLVGQSYVEFDLQAIFDGELFADFTVLYLLCHHSRFQPTEEAGNAGCWLEQWRTNAAETGARALGALREGVKDAIEALGTGFLRHPANQALRERLADGTLDLADLHRSLLRLVYRLLFLFVAEDRGLLLDPAADEITKARYRNWFSTARLRRIARRRRGTRHDDHWQALRLVLDGLGVEGGRPELGLPALGGLFENGPVDVTASQQLGNDYLLQAVRHLSIIQPAQGGPRRTVDYRNLGAEELGGIYESLLEFIPRHDPHQRTFTLEPLAGNDRKTSGAYYTPTSLIDHLLDATLDPVLDAATSEANPQAALQALRVCDPACGSGHFLVAAARRIAHRLARVRAGGAEPTIHESQEAMHDVVARCIYGVDLNPMAAELAKVSLWVESLAAGRPLGFLDAHIKVGNALLGTTPALLSAGIPDEAFVALEGDDKPAAQRLRDRNRREREGQGSLFLSETRPIDERVLASGANRVDALNGLALADVHLAEQRQREFDRSAELRAARAIADAWCAAFLSKKDTATPSITTAALESVGSAPSPERDRLSGLHRFFHWPIEFPAVAAEGGFDCVVGNPPFLSPLTTSGSRVTKTRHLCKYVRGSLGGPKADDSSYFLLLAADVAKPRGRVGMVLPDSFLSAADSAQIRSRIAQRFDLCRIWRGDGTEFEAAVTTVIVSLGPRGSCGIPERFTGPLFEPLQGEVPPWRDGSWAALVAPESAVVGALHGRAGGQLGDVCTITADYRDQYYGLRGAVEEADGSEDDQVTAPLVTTGLIDPLLCTWGRQATKFDKVKYERPVVRLSHLEPPMQKWATSRLVPKLLVATQGKMVEAVIDEGGRWLPCVPVISVVPDEGSALALEEIAAVLLSPAAFDFFRATKLGSGLSTGAIKVSAGDLRSLPLPPELRLVRKAADLLDHLDADTPRAEFRRLMNDAYGLPADLGEHWDSVLKSYLDRPIRLTAEEVGR